MKTFDSTQPTWKKNSGDAEERRASNRRASARYSSQYVASALLAYLQAEEQRNAEGESHWRRGASISLGGRPGYAKWKAEQIAEATGLVGLTASAIRRGLEVLEESDWVVKSHRKQRWDLRSVEERARVQDERREREARRDRRERVLEAFRAAGIDICPSYRGGDVSFSLEAAEEILRKLG